MSAYHIIEKTTLSGRLSESYLFLFLRISPAAAVSIVPVKAKIPLMSDVSGDFAMVVVFVVVVVRGFVVGVCRFVITKPVCISPRIWLV